MVTSSAHLEWVAVKCGEWVEAAGTVEVAVVARTGADGPHGLVGDDDLLHHLVIHALEAWAGQRLGVG